MHATNPEINIGIQHYHKPTNPKINIHHKPTNSYQQNSTHKPTVGIHISTTIYTTELRDREMKEPFGSEFERRWDHEIRESRIVSASLPLIWAPIPNRWLGFRTTEPYQIGDYGELPNRWTFAWVFFLWRQRRPHWVLNEFDGRDLIIEIWESLGQIRVWQLMEMRFWESLGLREISSRVKREREN